VDRLQREHDAMRAAYLQRAYAVLEITKGSALEIPPNTDDAWSHVLSFQGQSPW
jgi:hypothetical protein